MGIIRFTELPRIVLASLIEKIRFRLGYYPADPTLGQGKYTPQVSLNLQPGELVEVKTIDEIRATLDFSGRNRGLRFNPEMLRFCGKRLRVKSRAEIMIDEISAKKITLSDTVILEDARCDGSDLFKCWGGCPRKTYHFWKEIWLRRLSDSK